MADAATLLSVEGLSKSFGGLRAVDAVSLEVRAGSISSVIGPNGAGKTTFFNCVAGLCRSDAGSIRLAGRLIGGWGPAAIAEAGIARTFQNIRLFPEMTVLENVLVGFHCRTAAGFLRSVLRTPGMRREEAEIEERARAILARTGLSGSEGKVARSLPYGSQRRLEIARALATGPRLLLLDEPAAGMNPTETVSLMRLIQEIRAGGVTVLLIEHDMRVVMGISDRIAVLDHGEKIAEGGPDEVRRHPRVIEAYLGGGGTG